MSYRVDITADCGNEISVDSKEGDSILKLIGKAHLGVAPRGKDRVTVIKSLTKLGTGDSTGHVYLSPVMVNFALRVISENLTIKLIQLNTLNDNVAAVRYSMPDGYATTDEKIEKAKLHDEVALLARVLECLVSATKQCGSVTFYRREIDPNEDWEDKPAPQAKEEPAPQAKEEPVEQETEEAPKRSEVEDIKQFVKTLADRAIAQKDAGKHVVPFSPHILLTEEEVRRFPDGRSMTRLGFYFYHEVKARQKSGDYRIQMFSAQRKGEKVSYHYGHSEPKPPVLTVVQ